MSQKIIFVLGAGDAEDPNEVAFPNRLNEAWHLAKAGDKLVIIGFKPPHMKKSEAESGKAYLEKTFGHHAIKPTVILEEGPTNTFASILKVREYMETSEHEKLFLVTNDFHLPRCRMLVHNLFPTGAQNSVKLIGANDPPDVASKRREKLAYAKDLVFSLFHRVQRYLSHPV